MPSVSEKQARFMRAVKHNPEFAKRVGVPRSVGAEFVAADKKTKRFGGGGLASLDESPEWQTARELPRQLALQIPQGLLQIISALSGASGPRNIAEGLGESDELSHPPFRKWNERIDRESEAAWRRAAARAGKPAAVEDVDLDPSDRRRLLSEEARLSHAENVREAQSELLREVLDEPFAKTAEIAGQMGLSPEAAGFAGTLPLLATMAPSGALGALRMLRTDARNLGRGASRMYYRARPPMYTPPPALPAPSYQSGGLVRRGARGRLADVRRGEPGARDLRSRPEVVKEKGGNWASYDVMRKIEVPGTAERLLGDPEYRLVNTGKTSGLDANISALREALTDDAPITGPGADAVGRWLDSNLRRYIQTQWGSADDPLATMMVSGLPDETPMGNETAGRFREDMYNQEGVTEHSMRQQMDEASRDPSMITEDPRDVITRPTFALSRSPRFPSKRVAMTPSIAEHDARNRLAQEIEEVYGTIGRRTEALHTPEWMRNLPEDASLYDLSIGEGSFQDTFGGALQNVRDYLRTLPPERVKNVSVPDAFRNAARYHEALAGQRNDDMVAGGKAKLYKEYPSGFKWLELTDHDALRQEGQTMGHCVGQYCDEVDRGHVRILSLRDPKGRSHATVELRPNWTEEDFEKIDMLVEANSDVEKQMLGFFEKARNGEPGAGDVLDWARNHHPDRDARHTAEVLYRKKMAKPSIGQMKYKGNSTRAVEEYAPYLQDLVRSGDWEDVRDLSSSGLLRIMDPRVEFERETLGMHDVNPDLAAYLDELQPHGLGGNQLLHPSSGEIIHQDRADYLRKGLALKRWKKPYYYATPEQLEPYVKYRVEEGKPDFLSRSEALKRFPENPGEMEKRMMEMLRRVLRSPNIREPRYGDAAALKFPPDFEGFAKGGAVDAPELDELARRYELSPAVVRAVRHMESRGNPNAVSSAGAMGEMQLMPATARELGVDPTVPAQNREGGVRYLSQMYKRFNDMRRALAAYNWGPSRVARNTEEQHWPPEVRSYVNRVLRKAAEEDVGMGDLEREQQKARQNPLRAEQNVVPLEENEMTAEEKDELRWLFAELMDDGEDDADAAAA